MGGAKNGGSSKKAQAKKTARQTAAAATEEKRRHVELAADIRKWADVIYESDPKKFKALIQWIRTVQSKGMPDAWIAEALESFARYIDVDPWWPYLTTVMTKVYRRHNAEQTAAESRDFKRIDFGQLIGLLNEINSKLKV